MSQLEDDLRNLKDDALTKKDAIAAFKILAEVAGGFTVMYIAATIISALFGPAGVVPVGGAACYALLRKCGEVYANLPTDQRTLIRKLVRGVRGLIEP